MFSPLTLHGVSTAFIPPTNDLTLNKTFLPKESQKSLNSLDKVFYELILSDGVNSSNAKTKPLGATSPLWCKNGLIAKIKSYNEGLLYQKEILKATKEDIDQVIDVVNF
jgi:hypothetical protein